MRAFAAGLRSRTPTYLIGEPGLTKTASIAGHCEAWGYAVEVVVGGVREAADYSGYPIERDGQMHFAPPNWAVRLNEAAKGVFFGDELTTTSQSTQKGMLRLLQEGYAGDLRLGDHIAMVLAGNPISSAVDGHELSAPIANRMMHLKWKLDFNRWADGLMSGFESVDYPPMDELLGRSSDADRARVRGAVLAFLRTMPQYVHKLPDNAVAAGQPWPSPRSWTNAIAVLSELRPDDEDAAMLALAGCVGDGVAKEYLAWLAAADLHDPEEVLRKPGIVEWETERPDRLYALIRSVVGLARARGDKATWERAMGVMTACANGRKPDLAQPGVKALAAAIPAGAKLSAEARTAFADLFQRLGLWAAPDAAPAASTSFAGAGF